MWTMYTTLADNVKTKIISNIDQYRLFEMFSFDNDSIESIETFGSLDALYFQTKERFKIDDDDVMLITK